MSDRIDPQPQKGLLRILSFVFIGCLLFSHQCLYANRPTARFLLWQPTAASMAMGGAGVAFYSLAAGASNNPALLVHQDPLIFSGSYFKPYTFFQNIARSYAFCGFQVPGTGFFAVSNNMYWKAKQAMTEQGGYLIDGGSGDYLFSWQAKLSYAIAVKPDLFLGISLGYLHYNLWEKGGTGIGAETTDGSTGGFSLDLGAEYVVLARSSLFKIDDIELPQFIDRISRRDNRYGLTIGAALHNIGPSLSFVDNEQADPLPAKLLAGVSVPIMTSNYLQFDTALDIEKQIFEKSTIDFIRGGAELSLYQLFKFRAGYVVDTFAPVSSFVTWGIGLQTRYFLFQAACYEATFLPTWHYDLSIFMEL